MEYLFYQQGSLIGLGCLNIIAARIGQPMKFININNYNTLKICKVCLPSYSQVTQVNFGTREYSIMQMKQISFCILYNVY